MVPLRPADVCRHLLATLDASEGRRKRRKRNTTPDAIGLTMRRHLLEGTVQDDPDPAAFEHWLLGRCQAVGIADGPMRAMALEILTEWRLAAASQPFQRWLRPGSSGHCASWWYHQLFLSSQAMPE